MQNYKQKKNNLLNGKSVHDMQGNKATMALQLTQLQEKMGKTRIKERGKLKNNI